MTSISIRDPRPGTGPGSDGSTVLLDADHPGEHRCARCNRAQLEVTMLETELVHRDRKLATLPLIAQASGMLMLMFGLDADGAFAVLVRMSQHSGVKVRDVTAHLVTALPSSTQRPGSSGAGQLLDTLAR